MNVGIYRYLIVADFSKIIDYLKELQEKIKEDMEKDAIKLPKRVIENRLNDMKSSIERLSKKKIAENGYFEELNDVFIPFFLTAKDIPDELKDVFSHEVGRSPRTMRFPNRKSIFDTEMLHDLKDVRIVEKKIIDKNKMILEVMTINEKAMIDFKNKISLIPQFNDNIKVIKDKQHFSSKHVYKPYAWVVRLWLEDFSTITVSEDLKSFLRGATRYIFSNEWRTSIVLSAISIESVMADIYEEKKKTPAPDIPLGGLMTLVQKEITFPPEVESAVNVANSARVAAVHRSRLPVSTREACNALFGATNFIMWYESLY